MAFKLKELNGELGEVIANITEGKETLLVEEEEGKYQVWLEPDYLYIKELGLNIFGGESIGLDDKNEIKSCTSGYWFYSDGTGEKLYAEVGSNLTACIYNYCNAVGLNKAMEDVEDLDCFYKLDNGDFLREKVISWMDAEIEGQIEI